MNTLTCHISVSLDGFVAGANQTAKDPLGQGGERLHEWAFNTDSWRRRHGLEEGERTTSSDVIDEVSAGVGAVIMGRKMFAGAGPWDESWRGWWGEEPPFHTPVYVLTHYPRPSLEMEGGTVFHFRDASPQDVLAEAKKAANGLDIRLGGGPTSVRDFLAADLVDLLHVVIVPIVLGRGVRLWDGLEGVEARFDVESTPSPTGVTHLVFTRKTS
jgi:dihydrofolate reductase